MDFHISAPLQCPRPRKSLTLVVWRQYVKNFTGMDLPGFEFGDLIQKLSDERIKQRQRQLLLRDKRENEHERRLYLEKRIEESEKETARRKRNWRSWIRECVGPEDEQDV